MESEGHLGQNVDRRHCLQLTKSWMYSKIFLNKTVNDEDYPDNDLKSISDDESLDSDYNVDLDLDRPRPRDLEKAQGGRVPHASGDASIEDGRWDKQFQPNQSIFDDSGCDPNIPAETTNAVYFAN
ncbi:hypothetical protein PoB_002900300 [Plakobranchus ocellatus]|uniref:Uncharacterized protein n=1 Tax=Plakobranchus ocellatus TaxID=259542 RepID=A0AAV4A5N1_9GAST|nr:hypothetical protein PoB_002900300 [Plakobranchus ocellatus]